MKLKRGALWALLAGLAIVLAGAAMPVSIMYSTPHSGETGIIGGASAPTLHFLVRQAYGLLPYVLALLGVLIDVLTSIVYLPTFFFIGYYLYEIVS